MSSRDIRNELLKAADPKLLVDCSIEEYNRLEDYTNRRLFLYGIIVSVDEEESSGCVRVSMMSKLIESIMAFNRLDRDIPPEEREPIILYINSPGGDLMEGFALISAIETSKTPVYTVNLGQWSSMSFLIGITGKKRFSLPYSTFLLHDGSSFAGGSVNKMQDKVKFDERYEREVIRKHVLSHSNMKCIDYDALARVELYMLPEDAKERGFIDEIVTDLDIIL